jgi:protoheme IX farnesyltransferase
MILLALRVHARREGEAARKAAMQLFGFSILYLFLLFAVLLVEKMAIMLNLEGIV